MEEIDYLPLNRIADALFACAKELRSQSKLQERAVGVSERLLKIQEANLAVSQALEKKLLAESPREYTLPPKEFGNY